MRWARFSVSAPLSFVEAVSAVILETGCGGVEIVDPGAVSSDPFADRGAAATPGPVAVAGYLPVDDRLEPTLADLRRRVDILCESGLEVGPEIVVTTLADETWASAWKAYFKPVRVGERLVIKPSWETWDRAPGDLVIDLDPGMAFGTGLHPSTQLCLRLLEQSVAQASACVPNPQRPTLHPTGLRVLDWGTGSGILAIAAVLLGAREVTAIDLDPVAIGVARENVERNGLQGQVAVRYGSIEDQPPTPAFDLVLANIVADPIIAGAGDLRSRLAPGGAAIIGGIIDRREAEVVAALAACGMQVTVAARKEEWRALRVRQCA